MARINKYPIDSDPSKSDLLLGSDQGGATRNYTLDVLGKSLTYFKASSDTKSKPLDSNVFLRIVRFVVILLDCRTVLIQE